jgi:HTH DNA binding domain
MSSVSSFEPHNHEFTRLPERKCISLSFSPEMHGNQRHLAPFTEESSALLLPLARAQDALARLEASAAAASTPVREGLWARLAFREAAGWLAHQGHWIHPIDLALRDAGVTGSYAAAHLRHRLPSVLPATTNAADRMPEVPEDQEVALALTIARLWRRLSESQTWRPLQDHDALAAILTPLGEGRDPSRLAERLEQLRPPDGLPTLIAASLLARDWEEHGRSDRLSLAGIFLATCTWQAHGGAALPVWSAPVQRLHRLGLQPRRGWLPLFLEAVAEAAMRGRQELARLQRAEAKAAGIAHTARSHLPAAAALALRRPVVTPRLIASALGITHRAALGLTRQLEASGIIRETTGRSAWRAFAVA